MRGRSLLRVLTLRLSLLMVVALVLVALVIGWETVATVHSIDDSALASQAQMLAGLVSRDPAQGPGVPDGVRQMFAGSDGESAYAVVDRSGRVRDASEARVGPVLAEFAGSHGFFRVPRSAAYPRGMLGYAAGAGPWRIVVGQRSEQREQIAGTVLQAFFMDVAWLMVPVGVAAVLVVGATVRGHLRPLREAAAAAETVGPAHPERRVPAEGLPSELQALVGAVNHGLERLEAGLVMQRQLIGNVAHALRTPIAVLSARLDLMPHEGLEGLRDDVARMRRLLEQMLEMARLERWAAAGAVEGAESVPLRSVAVEAIEQAAPLAVSSGKDIALEDRAPGLRVRADRRALVVVVLNLIENAVQHTAAGTVVEVVLEAPGRVLVRDRGPGVSAAERRVIFERFHRAAGAPSGGAGLGLAIVAGIVGMHGGRVTVSDRPGGGACFEVVLAGEEGVEASAPAPLRV